jgi:uncharacterized protein (UPF0332 family)
VSIAEKKKALALHRLEQAKDSLDEAEYLFDGNRSSRSVMNRSYYAMFYATLALLIFEPYSSSKHSGILSYFNRKFIKEGLFPEDLGKAFNKAFDLRQRGDYREQVELSYDQVKPFLQLAKQFIDSAISYLEDQGHI